MENLRLDRDRWVGDGFIQVDNFLSRLEVAELQRWVDDIESWPVGAGPWLQHDEMTEFGPRRARSENFTPYHDGLGRLATEGALLRMASELLGEPAILFKEKLNYKHPGGAGYAPHQDIVAYPELSRCITCLVAVDDAAEDSGCLEFAPGWHQERLAQGDDGCIVATLADNLFWQLLPIRAGSLIWFHGLIPHRSGDNRSQQSRRGLYLTYNALAEGDLRSRYYENKAQAFADKEGERSTSARISLINHFRGRPVQAVEDR